MPGQRGGIGVVAVEPDAGGIGPAQRIGQQQEVDLPVHAIAARHHRGGDALVEGVHLRCQHGLVDQDQVRLQRGQHLQVGRTAHAQVGGAAHLGLARGEALGQVVGIEPALVVAGGARGHQAQGQ